MEKPSAQWLSGASLALVVVLAFSASDVLGQSLTNGDLRNPKVVVETLKSGVSSGSKASAQKFFSLGVEYRRRAGKDGNWGPAAKAFGESALLYPLPMTLKEFADSSLRSQSRAAARKGVEAQVEALADAISLYRSAVAADDIVRQLDRGQREQLDQNQFCAERFIKDRKLSLSCQPLNWLGIGKNP